MPSVTVSRSGLNVTTSIWVSMAAITALRFSSPAHFRSSSRSSVLFTTPMSATIPNVTILEYFLRTSQYVKSVDVWNKLAGAGSGGVDRMVAYRRDPDALELIIPQEFEQFAPQQEGLEWQVPCHARCAGVVSYYPLSIAYGDGI